ncbi:MAG: sigma-70 family RNA polymerase sigma factor [Candidatus Sumerlaeia bacterium]|nr:sigma-70 family RNA polymerase sigma factor [Candidatus Sumerlaeia bacterium]
MSAVALLHAFDAFARNPGAEETAGAADAILAPGEFERFQQGDPAAVDLLVERLQPRLVAWLRAWTGDHELADDIAQEAFVAAWRQRGQLRGPRELGPWIFTVARRQAGRVRRAPSAALTRATDPEELARQAPAVDGAQDEGLRHRERRRWLLHALDQLADAERELLTLRFFAGLAIKELSATLDMPMGTVGVKLQRSLAKARAVLEAQGIRMEELLP